MKTKKKLVIATLAGVAGVAGVLELSRKKKVSASAPYRGSHKSKTVHQPGCRYYDMKKLAEVFRSPSEAVKAGYSPCKVCLG